MDKKEKLQGMLDQIDEKTGTKSVRSARQERIEKLVREMSDDADIKEELVRTRLTFRKYLTEFATKIGSLDGIVDAIKRNKVEYPKQIDVKVTNTHDMPKSVFNVPSLFDIRKPTWIDTITSPIKAVNSKMDQVLQAIKNVKMSEDPEKPIAVRLSDGKKFYEAITQVFGGTQGNIINIPKVTLSGGQQAIPVANPDGTDISGGIGLDQYDYVSMALSVGDTTETWTFKTGGSGGTTTNIVVVVYTDSARTDILTVTKT